MNTTARIINGNHNGEVTTMHVRSSARFHVGISNRSSVSEGLRVDVICVTGRQEYKIPGVRLLAAAPITLSVKARGVCPFSSYISSLHACVRFRSRRLCPVRRSEEF